LRVFGDLIRERKLIQVWQESRDPRAFVGAMRPWAELTREFRAEGFYERFPAKGQIERVRRIHLRLNQSLKHAWAQFSSSSGHRRNSFGRLYPQKPGWVFPQAGLLYDSWLLILVRQYSLVLASTVLIDNSFASLFIDFVSLTASLGQVFRRRLVAVA